MEFSNLTTDQLSVVLTQSVLGHVKSATAPVISPAAVAPASGGFSLPSWESLSPALKNSLIGAGIGSGVGLIGSVVGRKKKPVRNVLLGALLGGGAGYALPSAVSNIKEIVAGNTDTRKRYKPSTIPSLSLPGTKPQSDYGDIHGPVDDRNFLTTFSSNVATPGRRNFAIGSGAAGAAAGHYLYDRPTMKKQIIDILGDETSLKPFTAGGTVHNDVKNFQTVKNKGEVLWAEGRAAGNDPSVKVKLPTMPFLGRQNMAEVIAKNPPDPGTLHKAVVLPGVTAQVIRAQHAQPAKDLMGKIIKSNPVSSSKGKMIGAIIGGLASLFSGGREEQ